MKWSWLDFLTEIFGRAINALKPKSTKKEVSDAVDNDDTTELDAISNRLRKPPPD